MGRVAAVKSLILVQRRVGLQLLEVISRWDIINDSITRLTYNSLLNQALLLSNCLRTLMLFSFLIHIFKPDLRWWAIRMANTCSVAVYQMSHRIEQHLFGAKLPELGRHVHLLRDEVLIIAWKRLHNKIGHGIVSEASLRGGTAERIGYICLLDSTLESLDQLLLLCNVVALFNWVCLASVVFICKELALLASSFV